MNNSYKKFWIGMCIKFLSNMLLGIAAGIAITQAYYGYSDWAVAIGTILWVICWWGWDIIDTYRWIKRIYNDNKFDE